MLDQQVVVSKVGVEVLEPFLLLTSSPYLPQKQGAY